MQTSLLLSVTCSQQAHLTMSNLALLPLLVLSLCLHACTARPLGLTKKDTAKYHFHKGTDKANLLVAINASRLKDYTLEENQAQQQKVANNRINISEICGSASTPGTELTTSFQTDSSSSLATKEQGGHFGSMLGPARHHHVEETVVINASEAAEDIADMDYAQPHRKPPIHNEKP